MLCDFKSSNILLDLASHTYLADFGLARILSTSTLAFHTGPGTPPYAPPEQNRMKAITSKSDIFSFGILLIRVIVERFSTAGVLIRLVPASFAGLVTMNIALLVFHILFLNTPPRGFSITAGCVLIALAFALGGLSRSRLVKMFVSSAAIFAAIIGTWWLHINFAASTLDLTPLFRYDYAWSMTQVSLTALIVSLPISILGNLINLAARND